MKKILIVFPDDHVSYSPTILNLVRLLSSSSFCVNVICIDAGNYKNSSLNPKIFKLIRTKNILTIWARLLCKLNIGFPYKAIKFLLLLFETYKLGLENEYGEVIAVDSMGAWITQLFFDRFNFLSLEVEKDFFYSRLNTEKLKSVIIQNQERFDYLFARKGARPFKVFFLPNSPPCSFSTFREQEFSGKLLYMGNIISSHGILPLINILRLDRNYSLTLKGSFDPALRKVITRKFSDLIANKSLVLDDTYTYQEEILGFISKFDLGFCLYDFNLIDKNDFNYITCPSGKLFNYYAVGLPVIGTKIPGLKSIEEFNAGQLIPIDTFSDKVLLKAIKKISENYYFYSSNSFLAGQKFNFDVHVVPIRDFFKAEN